MIRLFRKGKIGHCFSLIERILFGLKILFLASPQKGGRKKSQEVLLSKIFFIGYELLWVAQVSNVKLMVGLRNLDVPFSPSTLTKAILLGDL